MPSFGRKAHLHRERHRNRPARENRYNIAPGHVRNHQDSQDYRVETTLQKLGDSSTKIEISHYYSTPTLKAKLINLLAKGKLARETHATLLAAKAAIEATQHSD